MARLVVGAALGLMFSAAFAIPASAAPPLGPASETMSALPTVTAADLANSPAGYYRVPRTLKAPIGTAPAMNVYWMPQGSAAQAPPEIKALSAYQEDAALGTFAIADVTYYGPGVVGVDPTTEASTPCPSYWFCLYHDSDFKGNMKKFQDTYWQHLSNYGFNDETSSVRNTRANNDSKLSDDIDGSNRPGGTIRCYDSQSRTSSLGDFNDEASGVYNSTSDKDC